MTTPPSARARHAIGVVGAGRAGAVLGAALHRSGHRVVAVSGTSSASRARIAELLPDAEVRPADTVSEGVDLVLLAVPDDVLPSLVADLVGAGALRSGQLVGHLSGAHGLAVLDPVRTVGAQAFAMHPAMTFTGTAADLDRLAGISYGVTAQPGLAVTVGHLVADLNGTVEWIPEELRALYHGALVHGANHLITLVNDAMDGLADAGVREPAAVLRPLLSASLDNTLQLGDAGTVAAPLHALRPPAPALVPPYLAMARRTADRAIAAGRLRPADAVPLLDALDGPARASGSITVVHTRAELAAARAVLPGPVSAVLTMGALHEGHAALLRAARQDPDTGALIMTIFVNPLQFGPNEDFGRYPRTLDADLAIAAEQGVDLVFAPSVADMYPAGEPAVRINPGPLGEVLEGASRPGFFHGVLTVVLKLFHLIRPDRAYFGEKDYQQLAVIRSMVRDLDVPVDVRGVPTVREPDGLALSSRNRYLAPGERQAALTLSRALAAGAAAAGAGLRAAGIRAAAQEAFAGTPEAKLDYLALTDLDLRTLDDQASGPARLLVAAWLGGTRLIDNAQLEIG